MLIVGNSIAGVGMFGSLTLGTTWFGSAILGIVTGGLTGAGGSGGAPLIGDATLGGTGALGVVGGVGVTATGSCVLGPGLLGGTFGVLSVGFLVASVPGEMGTIT